MNGTPNVSRREMVRAALMGLSLGGYALFGAGSKADAVSAAGPSLDAQDLALLAALADILIPRTTTPGAVDVGVIDFIQFVFRRGLDSSGQTMFRDGVQALRKDWPASPWGRLAYVEALDSRLFAADSPRTRTPLVDTYAIVKRLTVIGYFTAEVAANQSLDVELYPGPFEGAKPVTERTRTFYEDSFGVPLERPLGYLMTHE